VNDIQRHGLPTPGDPRQLPFSRAVGADGWLFVSGQVPMLDGVVVMGGIVPQAHQAIRTMLAVLDLSGYGAEHVVRCGVWLDDARDFQAGAGAAAVQRIRLHRLSGRILDTKVRPGGIRTALSASARSRAMQASANRCPSKGMRESRAGAG